MKTRLLVKKEERARLIALVNGMTGDRAALKILEKAAKEACARTVEAGLLKVQCQCPSHESKEEDETCRRRTKEIQNALKSLVK